jgi:DNA-binding MarR family transcriptional regulator
VLLAIRGLPRNDQTTIQLLASRMTLKHHSAVELVDRLEEHGYVRRSRGQKDRRLVVVNPRQPQDLNQGRD